MGDNENINLEFLAKQQMRILCELAGMRKKTARIPQMERDLAQMREQMSRFPEIEHGLSAIRIGQAALSVDLKITKADTAGIKDTLPLIEGRLVRIEHMGFAKA